jgi:hypothetical protein
VFSHFLYEQTYFEIEKFVLCVSVADRKQRPEYEALKKKYESFKIIDSQDEHFDQAVGLKWA